MLVMNDGVGNVLYYIVQYRLVHQIAIGTRDGCGPSLQVIVVEKAVVNM